jgi:hypothetical protein
MPSRIHRADREWLRRTRAIMQDARSVGGGQCDRGAFHRRRWVLKAETEQPIEADVRDPNQGKRDKTACDSDAEK